jgi:hypothetical protein
MVLKKLDSSASYQKAYAKLDDLNLHDDDEFFAYKMQARIERKLRQEKNMIKLPPLSGSRTSLPGSRAHLNLPFSSSLSTSLRSRNYSAFSVLSTSNSTISRLQSRKGSSVFSSDDSMMDMMKELKSTNILEMKSPSQLGRRSSVMVKNALVNSILSRQESSLATRRVSDSADYADFASPSKEFFRRGSRRQSIGWSPAKQVILEAPVFITETNGIVEPKVKLTLKKLMKRIVNTFHFFHFMSKCLKNKLERGWEFDFRFELSGITFRAPKKTYRIASMARREHYFMVNIFSYRFRATSFQRLGKCFTSRIEMMTL